MSTFPEAVLEPPNEQAPCLCDARLMARHLYSEAERYAREEGIEEKPRQAVTQVAEFEAAVRYLYGFTRAKCCDTD